MARNGPFYNLRQSYLPEGAPRLNEAIDTSSPLGAQGTYTLFTFRLVCKRRVSFVYFCRLYELQPSQSTTETLRKQSRPQRI